MRHAKYVRQAQANHAADWDMRTYPDRIDGNKCAIDHVQLAALDEQHRKPVTNRDGFQRRQHALFVRLVDNTYQQQATAKRLRMPESIE
jgi:hypothetical protein